jgi:hypothetical protein
LNPLDQFNNTGRVLRNPSSYSHRETFSEAILERFFGRGTLPYHTQIIEVELPITTEQAQRGGRYQAQIPVETKCPHCVGSGHIDLYMCPRCRGLGRLVLDLPLEMNLPAGIDRNSQGKISLQRYGLPGVELVIRFDIR